MERIRKLTSKIFRSNSTGATSTPLMSSSKDKFHVYYPMDHDEHSVTIEKMKTVLKGSFLVLIVIRIHRILQRMELFLFYLWM
jgi:hypothetical protein